MRLGDRIEISYVTTSIIGGGEACMNSMSKWLMRAAAVATTAAPSIALAQLGGAPTGLGVSDSDLPTAIVNIINVFLLLAGLVAAIVLIIGGVQYITSRGDEDATEKAKNTILYAVIGLIVIGLSAAIVNFVISAIAGA